MHFQKVKLKFDAMKNTGLCIISMLGGAIVGSVLTMFLTPQSGPELRESLRDFVEKEVDKIRCRCEEEEHAGH